MLRLIVSGFVNNESEICGRKRLYITVYMQKIKGKGHPCAGTEALYSPYGL
jgi:hypothetical protein